MKTIHENILLFLPEFCQYIPHLDIDSIYLQSAWLVVARIWINNIAQYQYQRWSTYKNNALTGFHLQKRPFLHSEKNQKQENKQHVTLNMISCEHLVVRSFLYKNTTTNLLPKQSQDYSASNYKKKH